MSGLTQAVRNFRNIWGQGDDDYSPEDEHDGDDDVATPAASRPYNSYAPTSSTSTPTHTPSYGGGSGNSTPRARRLHPVPSTLRGREKNIYTIKPKSQDDATIAADYLKSGDAVIVNLEDVDRVNAVRIVDFMSGVCYGLEARGHAMKLGDAIFLYTPGDFEIRSDEVDYGENEEYFFKDEDPIPQPVVRAQVMSASQVPHMQAQVQAAQAQQAHAAQQAAVSGYINPATNPNPAPRPPLPGAMPIPDRRAWER
ncbi:MAG TPA: cell division protein SepF [Abditibacteriaceae bacterium]|jgi:cell division inhibitor SepF